MTRKEIGSIAGMLFFLCSPTLLGVWLAEDFGEGFWNHILFLLAGTCIYVAGISLFKRKTFFYIASVTFIPSGVEIVHLILNHATTSIQFLYTCVIAEPGELWELFTTYWWVLALAIALWSTYFYLLRHNIRNEYLIANAWVRYSVAAVCLIFYLVAWQSPAVQHASPAHFVTQSAQLVKLRQTIRHNEALLSSFDFFIGSNQTSDENIVVFLIGETSRYDHWQLNGYHRPTSPLLMAREHQLVSFDSCYTVSNLTAISVPMMLSRATPEDIIPLYTEKSVVEAYQAAGWRTSWIADQSFTNSQLLRISSTCNQTYYFDSEDRLQRSYMDSVLLAPLSTELSIQEGSQMIVIHSLGCHYKYSARYPKSFSVFVPDMKDRDLRTIVGYIRRDSLLLHDKHLLGEVRELLVNSYDNAIRYTDHFINEIILRLEAKGKRSVLIYVGDHGENLLDDERNMLMHGSFYGSRYEYHVPLFVWMSDQYREAYPEKVSALKANKDKCMSTMVLYHSLLDAGYIIYEGKEETMSIFSPSFESQHPIQVLDANLQCKELDEY